MWVLVDAERLNPDKQKQNPKRIFKKSASGLNFYRVVKSSVSFVTVSSMEKSSALTVMSAYFL